MLTIKTIKLFAVFTFCLLLTSCLKSTQLNKRAIVEAVGIDLIENEFVITVEYFAPNTSTSETNNTSFIIQKSTSISEAINEINLKVGKELYFGQNNIVVIGINAAENSIIDILHFFDSEINTKSAICIAVGENAKKIINNADNEYYIPKSSLVDIISNSTKLGICSEYRLFKILENAKNEQNSFTLPNLEISENGYYRVVGDYEIQCKTNRTTIKYDK